VVLLEADNTTAEAWLTKACKNSIIGRALGRLQCALMLNNPVGTNAHHLSTIENEIADGISRFKSESDTMLGFDSLVQTHPQLSVCRRFHPNPVIFSAIMEALLHKKCTDPITLAEQIRTNPGSVTI